MRKGVVKWFDTKKGYGFITDSKDQGDVFVHYSQICNHGYKTLYDGDIVLFEYGDNPKTGRKQAVNIKHVIELIKDVSKQNNLNIEFKNIYDRNRSHLSWFVVDENYRILSGNEGMSIEELAAYVGINLEDYTE